jgi:hypothetical protein
VSAVAALAFAPPPWSFVPLGAALIGGTWIWSRPNP